MFPAEGHREVEDASFDLISRVYSLAGLIHLWVIAKIGALVRSMSNLIEGPNTHPRDLDQALHRSYRSKPKRHALQVKAVAHIQVQKMIDDGEDGTAYPASTEYALWLHGQFCSRLP